MVMLLLLLVNIVIYKVRVLIDGIQYKMILVWNVDHDTTTITATTFCDNGNSNNDDNGRAASKPCASAPSDASLLV